MHAIATQQEIWARYSSPSPLPACLPPAWKMQRIYPLSPLSPSNLYEETKLFGRDKLSATAQRVREGVGGGGGSLREKLVSEVNKSICHNQFRCKIPSLLGQISLFLFEGKQKKKTRKNKKSPKEAGETFGPTTLSYASAIWILKYSVKPGWVYHPIDWVYSQQGIHVEWVHTTQLKSIWLFLLF